MNEANIQIQKLKNTKGYNYRDIKSNLYYEFIKESPCPDNIFVNTRQLERAIKFCKQLLKNKEFDDQVKDEFMPKDGTLSTRPLIKMLHEKAW